MINFVYGLFKKVNNLDETSRSPFKKTIDF